MPRSKNRRADALATMAVERLLETGDALQVAEVRELSQEVEHELRQMEASEQHLLISMILFTEAELYALKVREEEQFTVNKLELVDPLAEYRIITDFLTQERVPKHYTREQVRSLRRKVEQFSVCNG